MEHLKGSLSLILAAVISFGLGAAVGAFTSYIELRANLDDLTARVVVLEQRTTTLEQSLVTSREDDARTAADLSAQIKSAVDILTDLRIRLGPYHR